MRTRREKFDNRRRVDLTDSQADFLDSKADEKKCSFMAYVRKLIDDDMKQLSPNDDTNNTSKQGQNWTQPTGLYTAEQVAQLISAMGKR